MLINPHRFSVRVTNILLITGFLGLGLLAGMRDGDASNPVGHTPVISQVLPDDVDCLRTHSADMIIDVQAARFEERVKDVDVVIDTIGGELLDRSFDVLRPGGVLVTAVAPPDQEKAAQHRVRGVFFFVAVTSEGLARIADLLDAVQLITHVGEALPLADARLAHEMFAGKPHQPGKIVLAVAA
jgi:NADPH:quinone reductase-like Zn-dependent oxidoreductase